MKYTPEMIDFIRCLAQNNNTHDILNLFNEKYNANVSLHNIRNAMFRNKINKNIPCKKGRPYGYNGEREYSVGHEFTLYRSGQKKNMVYVKISKEGKGKRKRSGEWVLKHRLLWEQANGKIPEGYNIIFLDNNHNNFDLSNLEMASITEIHLLNKYGLNFNDKDMTKLGLTIVRHRLAALGAMTRGMDEKRRRGKLNYFYKKNNKQTIERGI